jgi:hypothetical protein
LTAVICDSRLTQSQKEAKRVPSEEYIIVEEEISEEEIPRQRGRVRERVVETIEVDKYSQPRQSSKRSTSRAASQKIPRKPVRPAKIKETVVRETIRRRSPSVEYDYVETERTGSLHEARDTYPRKVPVHFYDDVAQDQRPRRPPLWRASTGPPSRLPCSIRATASPPQYPERWHEWCSI